MTRLLRNLSVIVGALAAGPGSPVLLLGAQDRTPAHKFEVASVKPNTSGAQSGSSRLQPGGRFVATNESLEELILRAYRLQPHQLVGAPDWIRRENFDITAKAEGGVELLPSLEIGPVEFMLQSLFADRFGLVVHTETRELPVYALVLARSDKRLGPQLQASTFDCEAIAASVMRGGKPPAPVNGRPVCGIHRSSGRITGGGAPLPQLADALSNQGRPVVDRSGLTGLFDFDLTYTPAQQPSVAGPPSPAGDSGPSVFTALEEQLGLKLEAQRAPVQVLVVDRVERPRPD
jgi:uncharacterized protein (TIGR03435 family)